MAIALGKLGKKPAKIDKRTLKLSKYLADDIPTAPRSVDYTGGITSWGMMLNGPNAYGNGVPSAGLGNCTICTLAHAEQVWSLNARDTEMTPSDSMVLERYEDWCGYVLGDESTDNGGIEIATLNAWRRKDINSFFLEMFADPNPSNLGEVKQAIHLFGCLDIGIQLPVSVQGLNVWDVSTGPDAVPGSWGGHSVCVCGYRTNADGTITFICISWGQIIEITQAFWTYMDPSAGPYIDEAHAMISKEFINRKSGTNPVGLNLAGMEKDALAVTG